MRVALAAVALFAAAATAQPAEQIRLNQVGFYPTGPKLAAVVSPQATGSFSVVRDSDGAAVFSGTLGASEWWDKSEGDVRIARFSSVTTPGTYRLRVDGVGDSYPFTVGAAVAGDLVRSVAKSYYFQRASVPLVSPYADPWTRAAGHPDDAAIVHPSAATTTRPAGSTIASPRGWYDAGDFGKYASNTALAVGALMTAFESHPDYTASLATNVPESGDGVPDLLDETLWAVRWMLTMQDADGGVYHKLTTETFHATQMPSEETNPRYVVQKSLEASYGFAASLAQTSRVVAGYPGALPGLADSLRTAAVSAWGWARAHPEAGYHQDSMNVRFDPDVKTGEYRAEDIGDFVDWAAVELFVTTGDASYLDARRQLTGPTAYEGGGEELGNLTLLRNEAFVNANSGGAVDMALVRQGLINVADRLAGLAETQPYRVSQGGEFWHFRWGSNSSAAQQGSRLVRAYELTGEARYLDAATALLDYLLGRNATGYAFVTGFGSRPPQFPHHSQSLSDGVEAPVPGLMVGGPNAGQEDVNDSWGCAASVYPSSLPAKSYADDLCAFASSEPAINMNAQLFRFAVALEVAYAALDEPPTDPHAGVWYTLRNVERGDRGVFLDSDGQGRTKLARNTRGEDKRWALVADGTGAYRIDNRLGDRGTLRSEPDGRVVWERDDAAGPFESWRLEPVGDGTVRFRSTRQGRGYLAGNADLSTSWSADAGEGTRWELVAEESAVASAGQAEASDVPTELAFASVGPNPTSGVLRARYGVPASGPVSVEVFDVQGRRVVDQSAAAANAGWHTAEVPTGSLAAGVYVLRVTAAGTVIARTFSVVR